MATVSMRSAPRFGHSSDFSLLFSENQDDVTDYALGLIFIGAFLCGLFLMWLLIVSILKCIPSTGFLSGKKFTQPTRGMRVRIAFITCATIWIIFTILLVTEGLTNLQDTVTTLSNSNQVCFQFNCCSLFVLVDTVCEQASDLRPIVPTLTGNRTHCYRSRPHCLDASKCRRHVSWYSRHSR